MVSDESRFWINLHKGIVEILGDIRYTRADKDYVMAAYMGSVDKLKKDCIRLINIIESYNGDKYDGPDEKIRW